MGWIKCNGIVLVTKKPHFHWLMDCLCMAEKKFRISFSTLNCMAAVSRSYILVMTVYCTTTISLIMILWLPQVAQHDNIHILLLHTHLCHANFTETFCGVPTLLGSVCEHLSATVCGKQEWCYITTIYLLWYAIDECLQLDFDFDWKMPINAQSTNKLQSSSSCECF